MDQALEHSCTTLLDKLDNILDKKELNDSDDRKPKKKVPLVSCPIDILNQLVEVPFEHICSYLKLSDLIILALFHPKSSEKMKKIVFNGLRMSVEIGNGRSCISLERDNESAEIFLVETKCYDGREDLKTKFGEFQFARCSKYTKLGRLLRNVYFSDFSALDVEIFVNHLKEVFRVKHHKLSLSEDYMLYLPTFGLSLWECEELEFTSSKSTGVMPVNFLHYCVNTSTAKKLYIRCHKKRDFRPLEEIHVDIYDDGGYNLKVEDLNMIHARVIALSDDSLGAEGYNSILKNWISGSYEKLEHLIFWYGNWDLYDNSEDELDVEKIWNGVEKRPLEGRQVQIKAIAVNISTSFQIMREDGRKAVVTTDGVQNDRHFWLRMIVFKNDENIPDCNVKYREVEYRQWPVRRTRLELPASWKK